MSPQSNITTIIRFAPTIKFNIQMILSYNTKPDTKQDERSTGHRERKCCHQILNKTCVMHSPLENLMIVRVLYIKE